MSLEIQIPGSAKSGLTALMKLSPRVAKRLCDALTTLPPRLRTRDIPKLIGGKVQVSSSDLRKIVGVLVSLYSVRDHEEVSVSEFVDALLRAIDQSDDQEFNRIGLKPNLLKDRLSAFLSLDHSLGVTAKALSVAYENLRHYHSARVLTDVRPIFSIDPKEAPKAFVILHTLRLNVHESGDDKEWFVTLNSTDLENLKGVLDRAIEKEKSLTTLMKTKEQTLLEWEK